MKKKMEDVKLNEGKNEKEATDERYANEEEENKKDKLSSATASTSTIQERADMLFSNSEILAPMVRASTTPLRLLALSYGADLVYTEEIIDRSITTCDRIINNELPHQTIDYVRKKETFSPKVLKRMASQKQSLPVVLRIVPSIEKHRLIYQIGTGESNLALPAAHFVEKDVSGIDINMGCPKKFSVSGGMGSALLSDLPRACDIIKTLRRNISIPVSAKIRLLKDNSSTLDFVKGLIQAGANAVTIHSREVGDEATQPAKWDRLMEVVQLIKSSPEGSSVPIIINGDLYTRNDIINMKKKCKANGVMLARPALYNTSIFRKLPPHSVDYDDGEETKYGHNSPLLLSKTNVVRDYLHYSNAYQSHYKNVKYVICEMMNNRRTPSILVPNMPHNFKQTISQVCNCHSMDGLCKLWDVTASTHNASHFERNLITDPHRYDDNYFLDRDKFLKKRAAADNVVSTQMEQSNGESVNSKRNKLS
eukprot:CAMPEP_0184858384 /NCGR_PEP_ID=MMETSP0580-20130426/3497_1 /TAXON_ID=1118495 /ORGANISM="Dactyliosolen fragilissimus" /LENGTH=478 /DNA_ID=CAMNT_0027354503 /DNA_START=246 /DNA_END=1682 /DNA_ORIENTATION=+